MGIYYYDLPDWYRQYRGIDYDLGACLNYNDVDFPSPDMKGLRLTVLDVAKVHAVWTGENDGDDWRWLIEVEKASPIFPHAQYLFLQGGCDYTGWDCQSWAKAEIITTLQEGAEKGIEGRWEGDKERQDVKDSLLAQLEQGKSKTWREQKDKEFGL